MIAFANMIKSMSRAESALDRTTADGFATVKQNGTGWTWETAQSGLVRCCPSRRCHIYHSARPTKGYSAP